MSDTVYEQDGLSATRYWGGMKGDCVQITLSALARNEGYIGITLDKFRQMYQAIESNVEDTKDAWWHGARDMVEREPDEKGLYNKYIVTKANGKPLAPTFHAIVLRIDGGRYLHACRAGVAAFAEAVREHNPVLADDVQEKLKGFTKYPEM